MHAFLEICKCIVILWAAAWNLIHLFWFIFANIHAKMCDQSAVTTSQSKSYILQRLVSLACYRLVFFIFGKPILDRTNSTHHYTNWIMDHTFTLCQLFFAGHITSRLNVTLFWRTSDTVLSQDPLLIHSLLTDLRLLLTKIGLG